METCICLVWLTPYRAIQAQAFVRALRCVLGQSTLLSQCKWVPVNLMLGEALQWISILSRGEQKYSQSLHAKETGISSGLMGLDSNVDFTYHTQLTVNTVNSCLVDTPLLGIYRLIQARVDPYRPIQNNIGPYRPTQTHMGPYRSIQAHIDRYRPIQANIDPYGHIQIHIGQYRPIQPNIEPYRPTQVNVYPYGPIQNNISPYRPIQAHIDPYSLI